MKQAPLRLTSGSSPHGSKISLWYSSVRCMRNYFIAPRHAAGAVKDLQIRAWRTLPWRIWLKACVDRADQTTRIYTQKYAKIRQNSCAHYFKGIELCRLIAKINTRFQPDAPRGVHLLKQVMERILPGKRSLISIFTY